MKNIIYSLIGMLIIFTQCILGCSCTKVNPENAPSENEQKPEKFEGIKLVTLTHQPHYIAKYNFGTNVHAILESNSIRNGGKLGSSYSGIPYADDIESWNKIFKHLDWIGFKWLRLGYEHNDIQYEKGVFAWDEGQPAEKTNNYRTMLRYLDWAQEHGVEVLLQEFAQACDWNCIPGQNIGHSAPNDLNAWADGFVALTHHLVNTLGYSCITMLNISNEPANWWDWWKGRDIVEGYKIVRQKLDAAGIDLPLAGPEYMTKGFTGNWNQCKPYIDIFESHNYADSHDNVIATRPIPDPDVPTIWGEYAGGDNRTYDWNITQAKWNVGGYNNGIDGYARWNFLNTNNIDGNFSYIITWDNAKGHVIKGDFFKQPNLYHIDGLVSRLVARQSLVLTTYCSEKDLIPAVFESPNGNYTVTLVSEVEKKEELHITLQDLDKNITLYKYEVSREDENKMDIKIKSSKKFKLTPETNSFTDQVEPWSILVYSTFKLEDNQDGIIEDGKYTDLDKILIPLESNPVYVDQSNMKIRYDEGFTHKFVSDAYMGGLQFTKGIGKAYEFDFKGEGFRLYGTKDNYSGLSEVYIDGEFAGYASNYSPVNRGTVMTYDSGLLTNGKHHVKVVNKGHKTITSCDTYVNLDAIGFYTADSTLL